VAAVSLVEEGGSVTVTVQPAPAAEIAPIVAFAYRLTEREREVTRLCMQGLPSRTPQPTEG
jgi:antitoxin (DNA-binding transcriptional repressor) of toxin-antitoxin stability system